MSARTLAKGVASLAETISILQAARARGHEFAETLELHIAILQACERVAASIVSADLEISVQTDSSDPVPVLLRHDLVSDWNSFARLFRAICSIVAPYRPAQSELFEEFARIDVVRLKQLATAYLQNQLDTHWTSSPAILGFVLNNTWHPFLTASPAHQLWDARAEKDTWHQRRCPLCGGEPDFAALEKESGARRLLCSRCDAEWEFRRTGCPFCGETEPTKLGYYAGGMGVYRLYVCDTCRRYLKTVDVRELARPVHLPAERVLTIDMDIAAHNAGYVAEQSFESASVS